MLFVVDVEKINENLNNYKEQTTSIWTFCLELQRGLKIN